MKILGYILAIIICPSIYAMCMRSPRVARMNTAPVRAYHMVRANGLPPFKVVSTKHLDKYVQPIVSKMDEHEKYYHRNLHAAVQFWAIEGKFNIAAEQLAACSDITKSLILDQVDENGQTLLIKAAKAGYHDFMGFLLQQNANAAVADNEGLTALSINPSRLTRFLAHLLLENGVDITAADTKKRQALHYLAMRRTSGSLHLQNTPLRMLNAYEPDFSIYEKTNGDVARMLITEGAKMSVPDISGKTPIDYGRETEHIEILKAFIDCGAKRDAIIDKSSDFVKHELIDHCKLY